MYMCMCVYAMFYKAYKWWSKCQPFDRKPTSPSCFVDNKTFNNAFGNSHFFELETSVFVTKSIVLVKMFIMFFSVPDTKMLIGNTFRWMRTPTNQSTVTKLSFKFSDNLTTFTIWEMCWNSVILELDSPDRQKKTHYKDLLTQSEIM